MYRLCVFLGDDESAVGLGVGGESKGWEDNSRGQWI